MCTFDFICIAQVVFTIICNRPQNYKELFNLRHATARNVVERILGTSKREFPLMTRAPEYSAQTQAKLICATFATFNFIRSSCNTPEFGHSNDLEGGIRRFRTVEGVEVEVGAMDEVPIVAGSLGGHVSEEEKLRADARRDRIAKAMWEDYVEYIANN